MNLNEIEYYKLYNIGVKCLDLMFMIAIPHIIILIWPCEQTKNKAITYAIKNNDFFKQIKKELNKKSEIHGEYLYEIKSEKNNSYKLPLCNIEYFLQKDKKIQVIIAFININQMSSSLLKEYQNGYFYDFGNHLLKNKYIEYKKITYFVPIIIVQNKNREFEKYIYQYPHHTQYNYIAPIGVDMLDNKIYLINQNEGFGLFTHRKIKKIIMDIIKKNNK